MPILLSNDFLSVTVTPERGADIARLTETSTGIQLLAQSPTGQVTNGSGGWGDSMVHWINGYPGGWQILAPNAGPAREWDGVTQGFHGEASLATWRVLRHNASECEMDTFLLTSPLHITRTVTIADLRLTVTDQVTNLSPDATQFRLCQHPAFGDQFLDAASYVEIKARKFIADADNPGTLATPNASGVPTDVLPPGPLPGTLPIPGPGSRASLFGALTEFVVDGDSQPTTSVTFVSPKRRLAAQVSWDVTVFPYAWFWIEANALSGWPWFRRLYAVAIEPSNILPGSGLGPAGYRRGGSGTTLPPGDTLVSTVTIDVHHM